MEESVVAYVDALSRVRPARHNAQKCTRTERNLRIAPISFQYVSTPVLSVRLHEQVDVCRPPFSLRLFWSLLSYRICSGTYFACDYMLRSGRHVSLEHIDHLAAFDWRYLRRTPVDISAE